MMTMMRTTTIIMLMVMMAMVMVMAMVDDAVIMIDGWMDGLVSKVFWGRGKFVF